MSGENRERLQLWEAGIARNLRAGRRARRIMYAGLAVALVMAGAALYLGFARYNSLASDVREACSGVIANLDLTEWVAVCKETG